ncbi:MAG: hypothetical protein JSU94_01770 [Phycisphaerales bacterium]|nr:MAG: hypothetical protein JSU94_01770 [Phycisphaerales bacterium]
MNERDTYKVEIAKELLAAINRVFELAGPEEEFEPILGMAEIKNLGERIRVLAMECGVRDRPYGFSLTRSYYEHEAMVYYGYSDMPTGDGFEWSEVRELRALREETRLFIRRHERQAPGSGEVKREGPRTGENADWGGITNEDRDLFVRIGVDIKKHPERYHKAGKWLDQFNDLKVFWKLKEQELELLRKRMDCLYDELGYVSDAFLQEPALLSAMVRAKVFVPMDQIKALCGIGGEEALIEVEDGYEVRPDGNHKWVCFFSDEQLQKKVESTLEGRRNVQDGVASVDRFLVVCEMLLKSRRFLTTEQAERICLATWLLTDPDAQNSCLELTEFEQRACPDRFFWYEGVDAAFSKLGEAKREAWIRLARVAWAKLEAEMEVAKEASAVSNGGTLEKSRDEDELDLTDTEANILEALDKIQREKNGPVVGVRILSVAGYDNSSHYRQILSNLKKRGILGHDGNGYYRRR